MAAVICPSMADLPPAVVRAAAVYTTSTSMGRPVSHAASMPASTSPPSCACTSASADAREGISAQGGRRSTSTSSSLDPVSAAMMRQRRPSSPRRKPLIDSPAPRHASTPPPASGASPDNVAVVQPSSVLRMSMIASRSHPGGVSGAGSGAPITVSVCSAICSSATTRVDEGAVCAQAMPHDMDTIRDSMARMERWRMGQTPYRRNQPVPSEFRAFEGGSGELLRRGAPRRGCRLSQALRDGELLPAPCIAAHVIHGSFGLPAKPLQSERGVGEA